MAFLDETGLAELWELIKAEDAKDAKIVLGSYVGTGTANASLTFGFVPKLVIISGYVHNANTPGESFQVAINGGNFYGIRGHANYVDHVKTSTTTWNENTVTWTNTAHYDGDDYSFNYSNKTYRYIAIA